MNNQGYPPIVYVLPEDEADEKIANGFDICLPRGARTKILGKAGGYGKVRQMFEEVHITEMRHPKNSSRYMILIVDFDENNNRIEYMQKGIPDDLRDRVFVLGAWSNPEKLKSQLGKFEYIGELLARDCQESAATTWGHELLRHNLTEIMRMIPIIKPILFPDQ